MLSENLKRSFLFFIAWVVSLCVGVFGGLAVLLGLQDAFLMSSMSFLLASYVACAFFSSIIMSTFLYYYIKYYLVNGGEL